MLILINLKSSFWYTSNCEPWNWKLCVHLIYTMISNNYYCCFHGLLVTWITISQVWTYFLTVCCVIYFFIDNDILNLLLIRIKKIVNHFLYHFIFYSVFKRFSALSPDVVCKNKNAKLPKTIILKLPELEVCILFFMYILYAGKIVYGNYWVTY